MTTIESLTERQIQGLRAEQGEAGDVACVAICDLALSGFSIERAEYGEPVDNMRIVADCYAAMSASEREHLRGLGFATWTRAEAYAEIVSMINDAEAQP